MGSLLLTGGGGSAGDWSLRMAPRVVAAAVPPPCAKATDAKALVRRMSVIVSASTIFVGTCCILATNSSILLTSVALSRSLPYCLLPRHGFLVLDGWSAHVLEHLLHRLGSLRRYSGSYGSPPEGAWAVFSKRVLEVTERRKPPRRCGPIVVGLASSASLILHLTDLLILSARVLAYPRSHQVCG